MRERTPYVDPHGVTHPSPSRHPGASSPRSLLVLQLASRNDDVYVMGEPARYQPLLAQSLPVNTHHTKCYMRFCTSRRTLIDSKKKKVERGKPYEERNLQLAP
jgi:hypothetical protein